MLFVSNNLIKLGFRRLFGNNNISCGFLIWVLENRIPNIIFNFDFESKRKLIHTASNNKIMEDSIKKSKPAVLYHYPCPDGVFAALASHLYFSAIKQDVLYFPNTVYSPVKVEDLPLDEINQVYLLDFAGPSGFVAKLSSHVESVIILDHHKTAVEMFKADTSICENVVKVIDMERSGATIAYDYFKKKLSDEGVGKELVAEDKLERVNQLFKYIEDVDLWRWALPDSKAFTSGMKDLNIEYDVRSNPALFGKLLSLDPRLVIDQGMSSLSQKQNRIDEVLDGSYEIALGGGLFGYCLAADADSVSNLRSEVGHQLANKSRDLNMRGIGAVVYRVPELGNAELLKISLRSVETEDTTPISQKFGGGGHRNASSFMLSSAEFNQWKLPVTAST
ncbi:hypothetical protein MKX03_032592 [Papaver bracteatum]|nr:hypothetical protein MKX03_032592 [Papaver bracteatum]